MADRKLYLASPAGNSYEPCSCSELLKSWKQGDVEGDRLVWSDETQAWQTITQFFSNFKKTALLQMAKLTSKLTKSKLKPSPILDDFQKEKDLQNQETKSALPQSGKASTAQPRQAHIAPKTGLTTSPQSNVLSTSKALPSYHISSPRFKYWHLFYFLPAVLILTYFIILNMAIVPAIAKAAKVPKGVEVHAQVMNYMNPSVLRIDFKGSSMSSDQLAQSLHLMAKAQPHRPLFGGKYRMIYLSKGEETFLFDGLQWENLATEKDKSRMKLWIGKGVYFSNGRRLAATMEGRDLERFEKAFLHFHEILFSDYQDTNNSSGLKKAKRSAGF